jgi:polysaccharide biosynthesis/export protein
MAVFYSLCNMGALVRWYLNNEMPEETERQIQEHDGWLLGFLSRHRSASLEIWPAINATISFRGFVWNTTHKGGKAMYLKYVSFLLLGMFLILGASSTVAQQKPDLPPNAEADITQRANEPVLQTPNPRYQLRTGDVLEISFQLTPEFNQTVTIQPDGFINLRELPDMYVAGKTTPELTKILQKSYSKILHDPAITLILKEFEKPYFIAQGELGKPGKYELRGDTTVLEAIGIAGGFNDRSKHSQVLLFRRISDEWMSVKKLDMKEMLATADLSEDLHLRPGDMIYVPKNALSKVKDFIPRTSIGIYTPW